MTKPRQQIALCADETLPGFGRALPIALNAEGAAPEWIAVLPKGPILAGHDGRRWTMKDPQAVVAAFEARGLKAPIDINHAEHLKAPKGDESPAAGWIEELQARDGAVFGRVEWTPRGGAALASHDYRYFSPALQYDRGGNVTGLLGGGLVNSPNFTMPALNAATIGEPMKTILAKLGLPETASENDAVARIAEMQTALNARQPDLAAFVPRADYELALNARKTAEAAVAAREKADHDSEVTRLIDDALKAGKIAPASKDFYLATCASAEGLAQFKKFVAVQPSVFANSGLEEKKLDDPKIALNAAEEEVLNAMGLSREDYLAAAPKRA